MFSLFGMVSERAELLFGVPFGPLERGHSAAVVSWFPGSIAQWLEM